MDEHQYSAGRARGSRRALLIAIAACVSAAAPLPARATGAGSTAHGRDAASARHGHAARTVQVGTASVYARALDGRKTASGEAHDGDDLTAAHRTLPLGSRVRVTNLSNRRAVVVRINDRGPAVKSRIIDLSHAAADRIGVHAGGKGVARVRVEVLDTPRQDAANPRATLASASHDNAAETADTRR